MHATRRRRSGSSARCRTCRRRRRREGCSTPSRFLSASFSLLVFATATAAASTRELRVCADPNNLPFSNERLEGFENRIAELVANDLHATLRYTWWAQRRGFLRSTLKAGLCDVVMGLPSSVEMALATSPYYRSTYVFVSRAGRHLNVHSLDDPRLKKWKVGVQIIGDDYANAPPAHALARRGIVNNVVGFSVYGDYSRPNPPARIVEAVARGDVDVAIVWGPLAGYFARRQRVPLAIAPVSPQVDVPFLPFVFDISVAVRRGDEARRDEIDAILVRRRSQIERILDDYGVPRVGVERSASR
ncbi:MAG TPA: substrate-binding domain-containing protein [Thermoanaerobaculia bacterium]|nr:substrate-binding domain-containing protein [Thermoanaerobaculia bacterium]